MRESEAWPWERIRGQLSSSTPRASGGFGRYVCEPGWSWSPTLVDFDLWLVLDGRGEARVGSGKATPLEPGVLFTLRPGDSGRFQQDPDHRLTVLSCHFDFVDNCTGAATNTSDWFLPSRRIQLHRVGLIADSMNRVVRALRESSPLSSVASTGVLIETIAEIYRADAASSGVRVGLDTRLQDALDVINEQPARRHVLDEVARRVGLSARALSTLFSNQLGVTFRRAVLDARLDRAQVLLDDTEMNVNQIALALGYSDQFLFSRQFRARFGQPPSSYRRSVHNSEHS